MVNPQKTFEMVPQQTVSDFAFGLKNFFATLTDFMFEWVLIFFLQISNQSIFNNLICLQNLQAYRCSK